MYRSSVWRDTVQEDGQHTDGTDQLLDAFFLSISLNSFFIIEWLH